MWLRGYKPCSMRMQVPSLAFLSGLRIQCGRELWCRSQMWLDPMWLWHRPAATTLIQPLVLELPYAMGVVLKNKTKQKQKEIREGSEMIGLVA